MLRHCRRVTAPSAHTHCREAPYGAHWLAPPVAVQVCLWLRCWIVWMCQVPPGGMAGGGPVGGRGGGCGGGKGGGEGG